MAFTEFPRELDDMIASFMTGDCRSLSALCLVSRYCRAVAEPCLYRHVVIHEDSRLATRKLLITLVERKELASHISIADLHIGDDPGDDQEELDPYNDNIREKIASHKVAIRKRIENTSTGTRDDSLHPVYRRIWYSEIESLGFGADAAATLIVYMAPNIQHLGLHGNVQPRCTIHNLFMMAFRNDGLRSLNHLKSVRIRSSLPFFEVSLLPYMTTLELDNVCLGSESCFLPTPGSTVLLMHTLVLTRMRYLTCYQLEEIIECGWLTNLRTLVVDRAVDCYEAYADIQDYELEPLANALKSHTPLLERFEWINHGPGKFKTFRTLSLLRTLRLLQSQFGCGLCFDIPTISAMKEQIPDSLQSLTLERYLISKKNSDNSFFSILAGPSEIASNKAKHLIHALSDAFIGPESSSSLRHLKLAVRMETTSNSSINLVELDPTEVVILRHMADELAKVGFTFEVYRMPGRFEKFCKPLIKPGWTAALPHSRRLDQIDYVYHPTYPEPSMLEKRDRYRAWDSESDEDDGE